MKKRSAQEKAWEKRRPKLLAKHLRTASKAVKDAIRIFAEMKEDWKIK